MTTGLKYRPDIDGLRAIAVLAVVIFHLDPDYLPGGFVGVDIFFVISGFLITGIITRQVERGAFSFREFYRRRIKRILPVLTTVILTTLIVGQLILIPEDLNRLSISAITSQLFAGNVYFTYFLDTSYFAPDASLEPLLHLWSLGVEEQFYLFWPALLVGLVMRRRMRFLIALSVGIGLGSFLLPVLWPSIDRMFLYYMLPPRAGELLTGALCFFATNRGNRPSRLVANIVALASLAMISMSLAWLSEDTLFPGIAALPVSLGTAGLIYAGTNDNIVGRLLSTRIAVSIGLISYSMYLWHWPVLAYVRYVTAVVEPIVAVLCFAVIVTLSFLSYRFVEQPFRRSDRSFRDVFFRHFLLPTLAITGIAGFLVASGGLGLFGLSDKYAEAIEEYDKRNVRPSSDEGICQQVILTEADITDPNCVSPPGGQSEPTVLLWGDSNALQFVKTFAILADRYGFTFRNFGHSACPPVLDRPERFASPRFAESCSVSGTLVRDRLDSYDKLIIGASWDVYLTRGGDEFEAELARTVRHFVESGKSVLLLGAIPRVHLFDRDCRAKALKLPFLDCLRRAPTEQSRVEKFNRRIIEIAAAAGATYVVFNDALCVDGWCTGYLGDEQWYYDAGHLSLFGSRRLGEKIVDADLGRKIASFVFPDPHAEETAVIYPEHASVTRPVAGKVGE